MDISVRQSQPKPQKVKLERGDMFGSQSTGSVYLHLGQVSAYRLRELADAVEKYGHCIGVLLQSDYLNWCGASMFPMLHTVSGEKSGSEFVLRQASALQLEREA